MRSNATIETHLWLAGDGIVSSYARAARGNSLADKEHASPGEYLEYTCPGSFVSFQSLPHRNGFPTLSISAPCSPVDPCRAGIGLLEVAVQGLLAPVKERFCRKRLLFQIPCCACDGHIVDELYDVYRDRFNYYHHVTKSLHRP